MNTNSKNYAPNGATSPSLTVPTDAAAERQLIACLIDQPKLMPDALDLLGNGDVLLHEGYRLLFEALYSLYSDGKVIKLASILHQLNAKGKTERLLELGISLIDLPAEAHIADFAETCVYLRELWLKRLALESASRLISTVRSGESAGQIVDVLTAAAEQLSAGLSAVSDTTLSDSVAESLLAMQAAMDKPGSLTGVNTGLGKLNRNLGGWQDSDVIMIAGRPGMGKSVAGLHHTLGAAKAGIPVGFVSLEMPTKSMLNRLYASETGIEYGRMKRGTLNQDELSRIHKAAGLIERLPIHFYDDPNRDVNDLTYKLLHWKKRYGIGLVVIDYVQLLTDRTVKSSGEYEVLTSVSKKIKQLQRRLACPIIELAQLNRSVESRSGKRASMSDLRNTGQFEQDASVIIMLYRDDYYKEKAARDLAEESGAPYEEPVFDYQLEYGIVKNRDGETGTAVFWADVATNRIADERPGETTTPSSYPPTNLQNWLNPKDNAPF